MKPQLSPELEKRFDDELMKSFLSGNETAVEVAKRFFAQALDDQRRGYVEAVEKLQPVASSGYDVLIDKSDVLAILKKASAE